MEATHSDYDDREYGPTPCDECGNVEYGTRDMRRHEDMMLCEGCWDDLPTCDVCFSKEPVLTGELMCSECKDEFLVEKGVNVSRETLGGLNVG